MANIWKVRLAEKTLFFIGVKTVADAALCSHIDDYTKGLPSYAHVMENGEIMRHGKCIGQREALQWLEHLEEPEVEDFLGALESMLDTDLWSRPEGEV